MFCLQTGRKSTAGRDTHWYTPSWVSSQSHRDSHCFPGVRFTLVPHVVSFKHFSEVKILSGLQHKQHDDDMLSKTRRWGWYCTGTVWSSVKEQSWCNDCLLLGSIVRLIHNVYLLVICRVARGAAAGDSWHWGEWRGKPWPSQSSSRNK